MNPAIKNLLQASSIFLIAFFIGQLIPKSTAASITKSAHEIGTVDYATIKAAVSDSSKVIVDARAATIYDAGHIPNAVNIPTKSDPATITAFVKTKGEGRKIIVYCADIGCADSDALAIKLSRAGHNNVSVYKEGWEEWKILEPAN